MPQPLTRRRHSGNVIMPTKSIASGKTTRAKVESALQGKQNVPLSPSKPGSKQPTAKAKFLLPQLRTGISSSFYENDAFENVWLQEFLSHEKARTESIAKADLLNFTELPGSTVHPHAANHHLTRQVKQRKPSANSNIPDHEQTEDKLNSASYYVCLKAVNEKTFKTQTSLPSHLKRNTKSNH